MGSLCRSFNVFWMQLKREGFQIRIGSLLLMLFIFIYSYLEPVKVFSKAVQIPAMPWVFPLFINDYICQLIIMSGAIFLFGTAPFQGKNYYYTIYRSGRMEWQIGNVLYLFFVSFSYVSFLFLTMIISLVPYVKYGQGWGKIWGTLGHTDAIIQYQVPFLIDRYIMGVFSPIQATVISFFLEMACIFWLGLIVYIFNFIFQKPIGTFIGAFFVCLDVVISNSFSPRAFLFSPVTLTQLKALSGQNVQYGITLKYAICFYGISLPTLIGVCLLLGRYRGRKERIL